MKLQCRDEHRRRINSLIPMAQEMAEIVSKRFWQRHLAKTNEWKSVCSVDEVTWGNSSRRSLIWSICKNGNPSISLSLSTEKSTLVLGKTASDHKILIPREIVLLRWKSSACTWSDWTVSSLGRKAESFVRRFEHSVRENKRSTADSNRLVNEQDQPRMYSDRHRTLLRESVLLVENAKNNFTYFERSTENIKRTTHYRR